MAKRTSNKAWNALPAEHAAYCQNCNWHGHEEDTNPISNIHERTSEGDTVWTGDCPACGAMCFTVAEIERQNKPGKDLAAALAALKNLADQINLSKLKVRKDFSLLNAHAAALKLLHAHKTT